MNHKKILRLMKEYDLLAKIRRINPYRNIMRKDHEHRVFENKLNREFKWDTPYIKLWTDITYLRFKWKWIYLSVIKDIVTWEILWFSLSKYLYILLFSDTIKDMNIRHWNIVIWALLHSDQWFHYTHPESIKLIKENWLIQSMSRKWNCIDNAPTESFFGHAKDEIDLSECETFEEVEIYIEKYIYYYNNHRFQRSKKKMTPVWYRNHLLKNII